MSYPIPEGRRHGEWRITHEYKVLWWEITPTPVDPEQWYWKLLRHDVPVNGGLAETPDRCRGEANWAYNRIIEGTFCAVEHFDAELGRTVTRLRHDVR